MTIRNKSIFDQLPYCATSELDNEIKKFRKTGLSAITFFTGETNNIQGLLYRSRNNDGLCYIHPSELDKHVANNINLCYQTLEYNEQVIRYVVDGDILFIKNMGRSEPYLRIRKGVYSVTRDEYPELFKDCHEKISALHIAVSYNFIDSIFTISHALVSIDNLIVNTGSYRVGIRHEDEQIYYNLLFDNVHPITILKNADQNYRKHLERMSYRD